jgi:hypothetical protein
MPYECQGWRRFLGFLDGDRTHSGGSGVLYDEYILEKSFKDVGRMSFARQALTQVPASVTETS